MRILCVLILIVITILEIGPVPISGLLLMWVVLFRPQWFYDLVQKSMVNRSSNQPNLSQTSYVLQLIHFCQARK